MVVRNRKMTVKQTPPSASAKGVSITIIRRDQAPEEQHRFKAAGDALLSELVRQQLSRKGNQNG